MSWSLNIGSVAGTAIRVHVAFLLFLGWIFGVNYFSGGAQAASSGLLFCSCSCACCSWTPHRVLGGGVGVPQGRTPFRAMRPPRGGT